MPKNWTKAELAKKKAREEAQAQKAQANQNPLALLNPNQEDSNSGVTSESIAESIPASDSFASRAASKLNAVNESISAKRGRPKSEAKEDSTGDFANLLSSVIVIAFTFTSLSEDLKPTPDETGEVSLHAAKIIMRHVDINGKLTGDALDAIGIFTACATYYARIVPVLRARKEQGQDKNQDDIPLAERVAGVNVEALNRDQPVTPIQQANPKVKTWLDNQADARVE